MSNKKRGKITDSFIREVNVNYRVTTDQLIKISDPNQVANFVRSVLVDNSREHSVALYLDGMDQITGYSIISIGDSNSVQISPRELFQRAILIGSAKVVMAHNHPCGSLTPSSADYQTTQRLKEAGNVLGISILDHLIVTDREFLSLRYLVTAW